MLFTVRIVRQRQVPEQYVFIPARWLRLAYQSKAHVADGSNSGCGDLAGVDGGGTPCDPPEYGLIIGF